MSFLASDVMDTAATYLNDTAKTLYTYAAQLPYLKTANEKLELLLLDYGLQVQRVKSAAISITAGVKTVTLPTDFLLPVELFERAAGAADTDWVPMTKKDWEPTEGFTVSDTLQYWSFRDNNIYTPSATTNREVLLRYERKLAIISSQNSPEDFYLSKDWLGAKTAELCARYIGMSNDHADNIYVREVQPAEDRLTNVLIKAMQSNAVRRVKFRTQRARIY